MFDDMAVLQVAGARRRRKEQGNKPKHELHSVTSAMQQIYQLSTVSGCPLGMGVLRKPSNPSKTVTLAVVFLPVS